MSGVKVTVKTSWGKKDTKSSIKISAKTLGGALKELEKRDEWGKFDGKFDYSYTTDSNGFVTEVVLKPSYLIEMPTWAGYNKAPKPCQKEWDRMWKKLEEHEDGHRQIHQETLDTIVKTLEKAVDLTEEKFKEDYDQMVQDGQDNQKKFDTSTGSGSKKGVELNITEECE